MTTAIAAFASSASRFPPGAPAHAGAGAAYKPTREQHLAHVAGSVVLALGAAGIAWWRMPDEGPPGALVMWAVVIAIFFAGSAAARLVGVFTAPSGRHRNDG